MLTLINNIVMCGNKSVDDIVQQASADAGLPVRMTVQTLKNGGRALGFSRDVFGQQMDNKGYTFDKAQIVAYDALVAAGATSISYQNMRRKNGGWTKANSIFLNEIEGVPASFRTGTPSASSTEADLTKASTEYFAAGGTAVAPAGTHEAVQVAWYRAQTSRLKTTAVVEAVEADQGVSEVHAEF